MKRKEFEQSPPESSTVADLGRSSKNTPLAPNSKPVSFQIKAKDTKKPVIEYRSSVIFKTAKADESDEEEADEEQSKENNSNENTKVQSIILISSWSHRFSLMYCDS